MSARHDELTIHWHKAIIADAEQKLGRSLESHEREFITARGGYLALEMIHDTIKTASKEEVENYLNSEWRQPYPI